MYTKRQLKSGFTIIELIIVTTIIAVLASITMVVYNGVQNKGRDISLLSDLDRMDALQTDYAIKHNVAGKVYYSVNGPDSDLAFTPSDDNVISVVVNAVDYCIRGYNEKDANNNSIDNSLIKESTPGTCENIKAIDAPTIPAVAVTTSGSNILATITTPSTCTNDETVQYSFSSQLNSGTWTDYSAWSATTTSSQVATTGGDVYGYKAKARCYVNDGLISVNTESSVVTHTFYLYDALPIATSISGYWTSPPLGYLLEDGSAVSRVTYSDLFAAIGTTYGGGDGSTTFNLPNSKGRVAVNKNASDAEFATIGQKYGEKAHTLSIAEMFNHNHASSFASSGHSHFYEFWVGTLNYPAGRDSYDETNEAAAASMGHQHYGSGWVSGSDSVAVSYQGGNAAHNTVQPSIVQSYAIKFTPSTGANSMLPAATSLSGYFTSAPAGYLIEDGSAVSRTGVTAPLFAAIGTTYGAGDGSTTFNLPDSRGRVAVHKNPADAEFDVIGEKYGEKAHSITSAEMPSHNHNSTFAATWHGHSGSGTTSGPNDQDSYDETNEQEGPNMSHTHPYSFGTWGPNSNSSVLGEGGNGAHNTIQPSIVQLSVIKYTAPTGDLDTLSKGTSISGYWTAAPDGYLLENGVAISRVTYSELFTAIGTTYGAGDGSTTFNLPDSRGRVAVNKNSADAEFDVIGEKYGFKTHTLSITEFPSHNHNSAFASSWHGHSFSGTTGGPNSQDSFDSTNEQAAANMSHTHTFSGGTTGPSATASVSSEGGSGAHNNIQPSIVQNFAIRY